MRPPLKTCVSCPAALLCLSTEQRYTHVCTKCGRPWLFLFLGGATVGAPHRSFVVIFKQLRCEDSTLTWSTKKPCPVCAKGYPGHPPPLSALNDVAFLRDAILEVDN